MFSKTCFDDKFQIKYAVALLNETIVYPDTFSFRKGLGILIDVIYGVKDVPEGDLLSLDQLQ